MLEALELDGGLQLGGNAAVRDRMLAASHVGPERLAILPPAHHDHLVRIAVGPPDLQVEEPAGVVDEVCAVSKSCDELVSAVGSDPKTRQRHVHRREYVRRSSL